MKPLEPYQEKAKLALLNNERFLLADAPGVGKTWPAIDAVWYASPMRALFVVPAHLVHQWVEVAKDRYGNGVDIRGHYKGITRGKAEKATREADWLVTSYHRIAKGGCAGNLRRRCWELVVYDEAHTLRNRKSKWTQAALSHPAPVQWMLTGTPEVTNAGDWFVYARMLKAIDHKSYWRFVNKYCHSKKNPFGTDVGGLKNPIRFHMEVLGSKFLRREVRAVLDLTMPVRHDVRLRLDPRDQRLHASIKKEWRKRDGSTIDSAGALVHELRRLVSSARPKLDELDRVSARHSNERIVVLTWYREIRDMVARHTGGFPLRAEDSRQDQELAISRWRDSKNGTLVATLPHVKEGLDGLQHLSRVLFLYERSHLASENDQAIARLWRRGQPSEVHVYAPVVDRTIDAAVARAANTRRRRAMEDLLRDC